MKREDNTTTTKPFYKTANALLKVKIKNLEDVKKFYRGLNNFAGEILANTTFVNEFRTYDDNPKIINAVYFVLGYGYIVGTQKLFFNSELSHGSQGVKKIELTHFTKTNLGTKIKILNVQLNAKTDLNVFKMALDPDSNAETNKERDLKIKKLEETVEMLQTQFAELTKVVQVKDDAFWLTKDVNNDYYLNKNGSKRLLKLGKKKIYYLILDTIYSLSPKGGEITLKEFEDNSPSEIRVRLKNMKDLQKIAFIRRHVTDTKNGFLRRSKIGAEKFGEKSLIECHTDSGIIFNNKK